MGSAAKARWLRDEIGVDAVINYREAKDLAVALVEAAPQGIDIYFDNVGGDHLDAAFVAANDRARFVLCGMIAGYNDERPVAGPRNIYVAVEKRIKLQGMIVSDHVDLMPEFTRYMSERIKAGQIQLRETIVDGLENAPDAFIGLFEGANAGKMLVRVADA